jgi:hypothetical protein
MIAHRPALLLLCAVVKGDDVMPPPPEQQDVLLDLARQHRVERLAAWRIGGVRLNAWFGAAAEELRAEARAHAVAEAVHTRELRDVMEALASIDGARPTLFKGGALAHSHYPEPWLRPRIDSDILISPSQIDRACASLRALGYEREIATSGTLVASQASFSRTDRFGLTHVVDLHWHIANVQVIARMLPHDEIARRAVPIPALGQHARAAAPADALTLACLHRAAHHRDSEELLWIYDIHLLAAGLSESDWNVVVATAEQGAATALCARGLTLAIDRFGTPVPTHMMRRLESGERSTRREPSAVFLSKDLRLVDGLISDLRSLPVRARIRLLAEHLFPPAEYIRARYRVTSRLSVAFAYARRIVTGLPRWFALRGGS